MTWYDNQADEDTPGGNPEETSMFPFFPPFSASKYVNHSGVFHPFSSVFVVFTMLQIFTRCVYTILICVYIYAYTYRPFLCTNIYTYF